MVLLSKSYLLNVFLILNPNVPLRTCLQKIFFYKLPNYPKKIWFPRRRNLLLLQMSDCSSSMFAPDPKKRKFLDLTDEAALIVQRNEAINKRRRAPGTAGSKKNVSKTVTYVFSWSWSSIEISGIVLCNIMDVCLQGLEWFYGWRSMF